MSDIFSHEEQNKKHNEEQKLAYARDIADIRRVIRYPEGRRFLWWLLSKAHIFRSSFNMNTKIEDFQEGERNIGLEVLNRLNDADIGAFAQLQNENISERKSKEAVKEAIKKEERDNG